MNQTGFTVLRIVMGVFFVLHGWPKWLHHPATVLFFQHLGIPWAGVVAWVVAVVEVVGGALLAIGRLTRIAALLLMADTLGIIAFATGRAGFTTGWGYQVLMLAALLACFSQTFVRPGLGRRAPTWWT
ncbi:MAG: DoxX family protein [Firmicutes bacterium]|nr:DoxX family protein [Alicyclobacillaceae bacterium]MCL6497194.1 DoxX family protein [Bacillota bacterium]